MGRHTDYAMALPHCHKPWVIDANRTFSPAFPNSCRVITVGNFFLYRYLPASLRVNPAAPFGRETVHITVVSLPLYRQSNLNICSARLAVIKATHYSLLLHSSIAAPARLVLHSRESKKDKEHKFNSGNFSEKFCFVSVCFLLDFFHCYLNSLKRDQMQLFLATGY